jgi:hypothetical protein
LHRFFRGLNAIQAEKATADPRSVGAFRDFEPLQEGRHMHFDGSEAKMKHVRDFLVGFPLR